MTAEQSDGFVQSKRDLRPFTGMNRRWFARVEWKPQDCWIGAFWKRGYPWSLDVWVCLIPMVPIHFGWQAAIAHTGRSVTTQAAAHPKEI